MKTIIDLGKMVYNIKRILDKYESEKAIAVLKDNAYGHGLIECYNIAQNNGISRIAVSDLDEYKKIEQYHEAEEVIILKPLEKKMIARLNNKVSLVVSDLANLEYVLNEGKNVIIKFDTGLGRWGFRYTTKELEDILFIMKKYNMRELNAMSQLKGTYLQKGDNLQKFRMNKICEFFEKEGIAVRDFHIKSSNNLGESLRHNESIRIGAALFGIANKSKGSWREQKRVMHNELEFISGGDKKNGYYIISAGYSHGIRLDSTIQIKAKEVSIKKIFMDSTIISCSYKPREINIGEKIDITLMNKKGRLLSQMASDYGNCLLNEKIYINAHGGENKK